METTEQIKFIGDKKTFREIITKVPDVPTKILIPKIQRDYAQGRKGKEKLREKFLKDLFEVIVETKNERIYDYIYGQNENPNPDHQHHYHFYPVDGQQRLTTIFLLHLYIGKKANKNLDYLKNFSYQTRDSSKQFCELLCGIEPEKFDSVVDYIKDHHKYTSQWKDDPTISSMINMLEDIDRKFIEISETRPLNFEAYYENLDKNVQFWFLDLKDLKNTDDIYIKMNSRGKGLTDFENFKAELDDLVTRTDPTTYNHGEFANKIDTSWTNLFWGYRDKQNDFVEFDKNNPERADYTDNGLDDKMLNFFVNYLNISGLKFGAIDNSKVIETLTPIELAAKVSTKNPDVFKEIAVILDFFNIQKNTEGKLIDWFERFLTNEPEEKRFVKDPKGKGYRINPSPEASRQIKIDFFEVMMNPKITLVQKIFAEGIFYLICNDPKCFNDESQNAQWYDRLRILRNLMLNSELHDEEKDSMKSNLKSTDLLMQKGLTSILSCSDEFSGKQKQQELEKLNWMSAFSPTSSEVITLKQIENHSVIRGNLKVLYEIKPLSLMKFDNFRILFKEDANYDEIETVLLAFGDYSLQNGNARNYVKPTWAQWRNRIFTNDNNYSAKTLESALNSKVISSYEEYIKERDSFLWKCLKNREYTWEYYLSTYSSMRWSPQGWYLLEGERYLYYMFNASTCILSDNYIHYNVYNDAIYSIIKDYIDVEENNRGDALSVKKYNYKLDVKENVIEITLSDGSLLSYCIPQNNKGIDITDRVKRGVAIIKLLNRYGEKIYSIFTQEEQNSMNVELTGKDLKSLGCEVVLSHNEENLETIE